MKNSINITLILTYILLGSNTYLFANNNISSSITIGIGYQLDSIVMKELTDKALSKISDELTSVNLPIKCYLGIGNRPSILPFISVNTRFKLQHGTYPNTSLQYSKDTWFNKTATFQGKSLKYAVTSCDIGITLLNSLYDNMSGSVFCRLYEEKVGKSTYQGTGVGLSLFTLINGYICNADAAIVIASSYISNNKVILLLSVSVMPFSCSF